MKHFILILITGLFASAAAAQNSIRPNIYLQDMQYYNPASVAIDSSHRSQAALYSKYKFVDNEKDVWNKPANIWLSYAGRIKESNSFYTISYVNDRYSFFDRNAIYLGYTRQWKMGRSSTLSYGARGVANMDRIRWNKLALPHQHTGNTFRFDPDLDIGLAYSFKRLNAGIGLKNIFSTSFKEEGAVLLKDHREVNIDLSYRQPLGKRFAITPFVLLLNERNTLIDAGLNFTLLNKINASYALRVNELKSVIVLDAAIYKGWSIGIGYDRSDLVSDNNVDLVIRYRR